MKVMACIFVLPAILTMKFKPFIFCFILLTTFRQSIIAQITYSQLLVDRHMKDTFLFANEWDYSWEVFKDDSTGKFTKNSSEPLIPADTAHLFYTARCLTNVQGGYNIRYCFANQRKGIITLLFSDGLPAYASQFYFYIKGENFYFKAKTIYPMYIPGQRISYRVTKQRLTLNKTNYKVGDIIMGYIDAEFIETVSVPKKGRQNHKFYLRGCVKTSLIRQTQYGR